MVDSWTSPILADVKQYNSSRDFLRYLISLVESYPRLKFTLKDLTIITVGFSSMRPFIPHTTNSMNALYVRILGGFKAYRYSERNLKAILATLKRLIGKTSAKERTHLSKI